MANNIRSISVGVILIQTGNGVPTHIASKGSIFIDLNVPTQYINKNGGGEWFVNTTSGLNLTQDQYSAITGSTSPSSSNVFVTTDDLTDVVLTGGTYSNGTSIFTNSTGGTFSVDGFFTGTTTPSELVFFSTNDPNDGGTVFDPNTPQSDDVLYVSSGNSSSWTWDGSVYNTYTASTVNSTPWNLYATSIDAGGNKTAFIQRDGPIFVNSFANGSRYAAYIYSRTIGGTARGLIVKKDLRTDDGDYLTIQGQNFSTGENISRLIVDHDGFLEINGSYKLPNYSGNTNDIMVADNAGNVNWSGLTSLLPTDIRLTGGTYSNGTSVFTNNTGGTFSVGGFFKASDDIYTTGVTFNASTYDLSVKKNDNNDYTINLGLLASDMKVTGGTYDTDTGVVTFTNNTGGTFSVTGFTSGMTDSYTSSAILSGDSITFNNNIQGNNLFNVSLTPLLSGKTNNSLFDSHTGNTSNPHAVTFTALTSTGHTHDISDINNLTTTLQQYLPISGGTVSGSLTAATMSASTYFGDGSNLTGISTQDTVVTGGTYSSGTAIFTNNTGGTFNVTGFTELPSITNKQIYVGSGTNVTSVDVSGDVTISNTGVVTIGSDKVTYNKIQDVTQASLLGSTAISGGTVEEIPFIEQYITDATIQGYLVDTSSWSINGNYTGSSITSTFQGQNHYNDNYWFTAVDDNVWIRLIRG